MSRHLFIGDSILEGIAPHLYDIYQHAPGSGEVRIEAHEGWSTKRWLESGELPPVVDAFKPTDVVIALGTNDIDAGGESYRERIAGLRDQANAFGANVIWVGAFTGTGISARFADIEAVIGSNAIDGSSLMPGVSMASEIHPNVLGYRALAQHLYDAVTPLLRGNTQTSKTSFVVPLAVGGALGLAAAWLVWSKR